MHQVDYLQVMTFEQAEKWPMNPFDVTKVWPHCDFPLIPVGTMTLNRNPKNYFAEVSVGMKQKSLPERQVLVLLILLHSYEVSPAVIYAFVQVEQSAFCPAHVVPGIEFSPDKMLQGRLFSYTDTHFHRLGTNYIQLPINCPYRARAHNTQRDGAASYDNQGLSSGSNLVAS